MNTANLRLLRFYGSRIIEQSQIVYQTWGDEQFPDNATIVLRYRHIERRKDKIGGEELFPVGIGLDLLCPVNDQRKAAARDWIYVFHNLSEVSRDLPSAVDRLSRCENLVLETFAYPSIVAQVSVRELRDRRFLSIDVYLKSFYEEHLQSARLLAKIDEPL